MREVLLSAEEIVKTYPGAQEPVLKSVSAEIYQGDFTIIMGPSGAGKSTLLYALSGMDALSSGKVLYKGSLRKQLMREPKPCLLRCMWREPKTACLPRLPAARPSGQRLPEP